MPEQSTDTPQQEDEKPRGFRASGGYGTLFFDKTGVPEAMQQFQTAGYEVKSNEFSGGGGGTLLTRGKFVVDSGGYGSGWTKETDEENAEIGNGGGYADVGYIIAERWFFRLYPLIGFYGGGAGYSISGDQREEAINGGVGRGGLQFGLGIDFKIPLWRLRFILGLRFGYQLPAFRAAEGTSAGRRGVFYRVQSGFDVVTRRKPQDNNEAE